VRRKVRCVITKRGSRKEQQHGLTSNEISLTLTSSYVHRLKSLISGASDDEAAAAATGTTATGAAAAAATTAGTAAAVVVAILQNYAPVNRQSMPEKFAQHKTSCANSE
jgi:hypothetical protein